MRKVGHGSVTFDLPKNKTYCAQLQIVVFLGTKSGCDRPCNLREHKATKFA